MRYEHPAAAMPKLNFGVLNSCVTAICDVATSVAISQPAKMCLWMQRVLASPKCLATWLDALWFLD